MGNGNGRGDVVYALVDDVSELKAKASKYEEDMAAIRADQAAMRQDMTFMRKQMSDMMAVVQASADRLVTMSAKLDNHEQRLVRIEALLTSWRH